MRALQYSFDEAIASLWRGRPSGVLSTATIAVALFVLGAFLIITSNLEQLGSEWSRAAEMSVYLSEGVTVEDTKEIERLLAPGDIVQSFAYVSKAEALRKFKETFSDLAAAFDALEENPLPASYEVRLRADADRADAVDNLALLLRQAPGVDDVRYDREWLDRLGRGIRVVGTIGFLLGGLLTIAAALTVANVVRLALNARRDEIEIMELVGAPQAYIRGPFVMEGILQGGIGAVVSLLALAVVFFAMHGRYLAPLAEAVNLTAVRFLPLGLCFLLVGGGMAVGCVGGLVAASGRR